MPLDRVLLRVPMMTCSGIVDTGHGAVQGQRSSQLAVAGDQRLAPRTSALRCTWLPQLMGCQIRGR